jgi:hypothetical protein
MSWILLVLGILLAAAGGSAVGFGILTNELPHGSTFILAGSVVAVGGVVLFGLSAVLAELTRVRTALKALVPAPAPQAVVMPAARSEVVAPPAEAVAREPVKEVDSQPEPAPAAAITVATAAATAPAPTVEVSPSAIERLRSSIPRADKVVPEAEEAVPLSPNGQQAAHHVEPPPQVEPAPRSAGAAGVETREPRLDFLFRPRQARQAPAQPAPQQEAFDSLWPKRPVREGQPDPRLEVARAPAAAPGAPAPAPEIHTAPTPSPAPPERTVAILKSGVVDGMAYTLYADGSIEAQLPHGTVRFGSIAELRAHIESNV